MKEIYMDEASQEFAKCCQAAGIHLQNQAGGKIDTWLKAKALLAEIS